MKKHIFTLSALSLLCTHQIYSQSVDFLSLSTMSLASTENFEPDERIIVMEGDIASPTSLPANFLYSSNVTVINDNAPAWSQIFTDLATVKSNVKSLSSQSLSGSQSGTTIYPGVYTVEGNLDLSGFVDLSGQPNDEFIFNVTGDLIFSDFTTVIFEGLNPKNIVWNIEGNIYSGHNSTVAGIFLADGYIHFENHIRGPVSLFSQNSDIKPSSLLNIHSPDGHFVQNSQNQGGDDCLTGPSLTAMAGCAFGVSPLTDPSNWKLENNYNIDAPVIEVGINMHIMQDDNGGNNYQDNPNGDRLVLLQLFDWASSFIRYPSAPTKPVVSVCGTCYVRDSKIQLVLKKTEFYTSNSLNVISLNVTPLENAMNARDPEMIKDINVFWTQGVYGTAAGHASMPYELNRSNNEHFMFAVMLNSYNQYNQYNPANQYQGNYATALFVAHEVGHNLGFYHTYVDGGAGAICNTNNVNYLEDVHGPVGSQLCPHAPIGGNWGCDANNSDPNCTNNLMSGNNNSRYLSPKQIGMAHVSFRSKSTRQKINNCPYTATPLEISANQTWDKDIFLFRDIVVKNQSVLTITCKIGMPENGKIIVEEGSKLVIDGGEISNSCKEKFWYGIVLMGNNNYNQFPFSQPTHQAKLELKNGALIDNVMYAITFGGSGNWTDFGGLVQAEDATIRVSRRAVQFMKYPFQNNSYFKRCTFEYVSTITEIPLPLVTLWDTYGVNFSGCTFQDNTRLNLFEDDKAIGIFSMDAGYQVTADCNDPAQTSPCGAQYNTRSLFKNLNIGIKATSSSTNKYLSITETDFEDNSLAVLINSFNNIRFEYNHVLAGGVLKANHTSNYHYGLNINYSSGFEIENNTFEGKNNPVKDVVGLRIAESGTEANQVYRNNFINNFLGQEYFGRNRNVNPYEGLQFLCNKNTISNNTDVSIRENRYNYRYYDDGVRTFQGSTNPEKSAGNLFSTDPLSTSIFNSSSSGIMYHYSNINELPINYTQGKVLPKLVANTNVCAELSFSNVSSSEFFGLRSQYDVVMYNYFQQIDNGNTDSLVQAINMSWSNEALDLRNDLMSQAPYLSQEALWEAAGSGVLTDAFLLEVSLANIDATRNEAFLDYIEFEIPDPLPASMIQLIYQSWGDETPRTLLENQLANINSEMGVLSNSLLGRFMADSINNSDSIYSLLDARRNTISKYRAIEVAIANEDYPTVNNYLTQLDNVEISENETSEHSNFISYVQFRESMNDNSKNVLQLDESELTSLRIIAEAKTGRSSQLAQNILCFGYGECGTNQEVEGRLKSRRVYDMTKKSERDFISAQVSISPNPVKTNFTLTLNNIASGSLNRIRITNLSGQLVMDQSFNGNSNQFKVSNLENGTYIYEVISNDQSIEKGKIVIQH